MLINARAANGISYSRPCPTHLLAVAEEHPKIVGNAADSRASPAFLAEKDKESFYIRNPKRAELFLSHVLEELFQVMTLSGNRCGRKAPLHINVATEGIDLLLMWNWRTI